jgi:hypothetical protein
MATLARATIMDLVLEAIGVKPAGVTASAEDTDIAGKAFDSMYRRLRKRGLVAFADSVVPDWIWGPLVDVIAGDCAHRFGITGQRLMEIKAAAKEGHNQIAIQMQGKRHPVPTRFRDY